MAESTTAELTDETAVTGDDLASDQAGEVLAGEVLVEEVSIDGMCGVY